VSQIKRGHFSFLHNFYSSRSRSWPHCVWCPLSRKRLEIHIWWQWSTYRK